MLPGILAEIADVAGEDAAITIARAMGGAQVYIPPVPGPDHWLTRLVGQERAGAIAERLTAGLIGRRVTLPLGPRRHDLPRRAQLDRLIAEGRSTRDIVLTTGYTTRRVEQRRAELRERGPDSQLKLF